MRFGRRRELDKHPPRGLRATVRGDSIAEAIVARIRQVSWDELGHAFGPADDVGPDLEALTLGDEPTRRAAWNELWGNVHHQGTVYEATIPAVEVLADLARWDAFPDRREAMCMLAAFAEGDGSRAPEVAAAVRVRAIELVSNWPDEPDLVQRALLLLSRSAGAVDQRLLNSILPDRYMASWALGTSREIWARFGDEQPLAEDDIQQFDATMDGLSELEAWAFSEE